MKCPYCDHSRIYQLSQTQRKCAKCKRKFSIKKLQKDHDTIEAFCDDKTINETAKILKINYITVKKRFDLFRHLIARHLEDTYNRSRVAEYDEYIYLPKSKKKIKENIFDAYNFLTFSYQERVYNLPMPNLKRYKNQFLDDGLDTVYFKELSRFMMFHKIAKTDKKENNITRFWDFFERSIVKYKGIDYENFFYYLKEIEFKFNYQKDEAQEILRHLLKDYKA